MDNTTLILQKIVRSFEQLVAEESFPLYQKLLVKYTNVLAEYEQEQDPEKVKAEIKWSSRIMMEAPTDGDIGL